MNTFLDWATALPPLLLLALLAWAVCTAKRNTGLIDIFWSLFLLLAALWFFRTTATPGWETIAVLVWVAVWALRLSIYLAIRNWNAPEDHRYQAIRARNQPGFEWKSLYLVFGLQAVLAFIVSAPLYVAMTQPLSPTPLYLIGMTLAIAGLIFESLADAQLRAFKAKPESKGRVLDTGLWRWSRHPNYFGEFCFWWGMGLIALSTGAWWTLISPLLMSVLLMKVSGVGLLEKDIGERRPAYADYIARTNAFFPGPRKS